ncbi:GDSL-type esterase/lipase family protein [Nonomuraea sp. NPDC049625]|uniref:GDSL-type esterase/lipase family protein n=1 Tax=Nonomuraea sp. NPDC049625 TaxID=3155775 RepID=UPI003428D8E8
MMNAFNGTRGTPKAASCGRSVGEGEFRPRHTERRYLELYAYLKDSWNRVDFVGSVKAGEMSDKDDQGHPGKRIGEIAAFACCTVPRYQPNVITLHAGTNDLNRNYNLPAAPTRLKKLINQALTHSPRATVLAAKLIPTGKAGCSRASTRTRRTRAMPRWPAADDKGWIQTPLPENAANGCNPADSPVDDDPEPRRQLDSRWKGAICIRPLSADRVPLLVLNRPRPAQTEPSPPRSRRARS